MIVAMPCTNSGPWTCRLRAVAARLGMAVAALLVAASAVHAEPEAGSKPSIWIVTVGSWATLEPSFEGSNALRAAGRPIFNLRRSDAKEWLVLPNDGFDYELIETDNFRAGPVANWRWLRPSDQALPRGYRQIGSLDLSVEAGAFAEYWVAPWLRSRAEVRDNVVGGRGVVADLTSDLVWRPGSQWIITAGPRVSLADAEYMRTYFGVSSAQSQATGLPSYAAHAGVRWVGAGTSTKYDWSPAWSTLTFIEYHRLVGSPADSPVISSHGARDQLSVGVGLSYNFSIGQ